MIVTGLSRLRSPGNTVVSCQVVGIGDQFYAVFVRQRAELFGLIACHNENLRHIGFLQLLYLALYHYLAFHDRQCLVRLIRQRCESAACSGSHDDRVLYFQYLLSFHTGKSPNSIILHFSVLSTIEEYLFCFAICSVRWMLLLFHMTSVSDVSALEKIRVLFFMQAVSSGFS